MDSPCGLANDVANEKLRIAIQNCLTVGKDRIVNALWFQSSCKIPQYLPSSLLSLVGAFGSLAAVLILIALSVLGAEAK